ncbi:MAG: glycoside hydrolase family 99-like domain-containing protein [Phycisphaerae bacterium]|nr:glycoside hydrolase family 99-like domain-containing protein [Phycisphaerae bacterium]
MSKEQEESGFDRRRLLKSAAALGVAGNLPTMVLPASGAERRATSSRARGQVVAVYCPLWHRYDHMDSWHGYGWCEWELVKGAIPRFPGHYQPLRPSWGFFDESDPKWSRREIDLAADHGIDVFLFDWYWYSGVRLMEEALENGFLKAPNRNRLKFALMWANHDWSDYFPAPYDKPWNSWLPSRHSPADLARVIDYCIHHYFRQPNYWTVEGRLFFSIFAPGRFINQLGGAANTRSLLAAIDGKLGQAGLPPVHWNAMTGDPRLVAQLQEAGFRSTTTYNVVYASKTSANLTQEYDDLITSHVHAWKGMAQTSLPYCPVVTMGWDVTPRCERNVKFPFAKTNYPYTHVVVGNTPERFGRLCKLAADFVAGDAKRPPAVFVNAWNEWTEGSYLLPEEKHGIAYLQALKRAWGG